MLGRTSKNETLILSSRKKEKRLFINQAEYIKVGKSTPWF